MFCYWLDVLLLNLCFLQQKGSLLEENLKTLFAETAIRTMHFPNSRFLISGGGDRKIRFAIFNFLPSVNAFRP
jgi:hypothetical protein